MSNETDFFIKEGDTSPPIRARLLEDDGTPVPLDGAVVHFKMKPVGGDTLTVDSTATIDTASDGDVSYGWSSGDTDDPGYYNAVFAVDYDGGGEIDETFPNEQYVTVKIDEGI